jgi:TPP-dependent pyruvate/acetoin dehydrogenase alpha subunit
LEYQRDFLEGLYRTMVGIRLCEESFVDQILKGKIRTPCHLYSGEEAIAAGICAALDPGDYVFGNHRSHGHFVAKGGDMARMVAEIFCRDGGCSFGRGGSMHLVDPAKGMLGSAPIVAGTISLATGAALASSIRGDRRVTVSFFGDGAAGEGVLYESLNFASLNKLAILFVCENNFYSTHMPIRECRVDSSIYKVAEPFCIEGLQVDGNNVLEVYEAGKKAVEQCRAGKGPCFVECLTYRLRGHVGPDDNIQGGHTDIRPKDEVNFWFERDPIKNFEAYLLRNRLFEQETLERFKRDAEKEVAEAHRFAMGCPPPKRKDLAKNVFKKETPV